MALEGSYRFALTQAVAYSTEKKDEAEAEYKTELASQEPTRIERAKKKLDEATEVLKRWQSSMNKLNEEDRQNPRANAGSYHVLVREKLEELKRKKANNRELQQAQRAMDALDTDRKVYLEEALADVQRTEQTLSNAYESGTQLFYYKEVAEFDAAQERLAKAKAQNAK